MAAKNGIKTGIVTKYRLSIISAVTSIFVALPRATKLYNRPIWYRFIKIWTTAWQMPKYKRCG